MNDLRHALLDIAETRDALARRVADWLVERLSAGSGMLSIALSGGSTPRPVYELLAAPPLAARMPWSRIHWFWGDERFVPWDHPESNYRMAHEALLSRAPVPSENVHPISTTGQPEDAAAAYDAGLRGFAATRPQRLLFDIVLLGIGTDGHTASLFPGAPALEERSRWAVAVPHPDVTRITLTYPAIAESAAVAFIAAGAKKRDPLTRIFAGHGNLPAARVRSKGEVHCFLDREAAPPR
jgi:6-phosphogluconolactonase